MIGVAPHESHRSWSNVRDDRTPREWQGVMIAYVKHLESRVQASKSPDVCERLHHKGEAETDIVL